MKLIKQLSVNSGILRRFLILSKKYDFGKLIYVKLLLILLINIDIDINIKLINIAKVVET